MDQQDNQINKPVDNQPSGAPAPGTQQSPTVPGAPQAPAQQTPQTAPPQTEAAAAEEGTNYTTNVGQSMIDLLTDISLSDVKKQVIATKMRLPLEQVDAICNKLLGKIDAEDLTEADLAFLMTAPIADSTNDHESSK